MFAGLARKADPHWPRSHFYPIIAGPSKTFLAVTIVAVAAPVPVIVAAIAVLP